MCVHPHFPARSPSIPCAASLIYLFYFIYFTHSPPPVSLFPLPPHVFSHPARSQPHPHRSHLRLLAPLPIFSRLLSLSTLVIPSLASLLTVFA